MFNLSKWLKGFRVPSCFIILLDIKMLLEIILFPWAQNTEAKGTYMVCNFCQARISFVRKKTFQISHYFKNISFFYTLPLYYSNPRNKYQFSMSHTHACTQAHTQTTFMCKFLFCLILFSFLPHSLAMDAIILCHLK